MRSPAPVLIFLLMSFYCLAQNSGRILVKKPDTVTRSGKIPPVKTETGIRSCKIYTVNDKYNLKNWINLESVYDSAGRMILEIDHFKDVERRFDYDSLGRLHNIETNRYKQKRILYMEDFFYPEPGICVMVRRSAQNTFGLPTDTDLVEQTRYDEKAQVLRIERKFGNNSTLEIWTYDSIGRLSAKLRYCPGKEGKPEYVEQHTYNDTTHIVTADIFSYSSGGERSGYSKKWTERTDNSGRLLEWELLSENILQVRKRFTYLANGRINDMRSFENAEAGTKISHHIYVYSYY